MHFGVQLFDASNVCVAFVYSLGRAVGLPVWVGVRHGMRMSVSVMVVESVACPLDCEEDFCCTAARPSEYTSVISGIIMMPW